MNSVELLDAVRARHGLPSDRKLARALGVHDSRISLVRNGHRKLDGALCIKVAELLDAEPGYVLALVAAERANNEAVRAQWLRAAKVLKKRSRAAMLATFMLAGTVGQHAGAPSQSMLSHSGQNIHYAQYRLRRLALRQPAAVPA